MHLHPAKNRNNRQYPLPRRENFGSPLECTSQHELDHWTVRDNFLSNICLSDSCQILIFDKTLIFIISDPDQYFANQDGDGPRDDSFHNIWIPWSGSCTSRDS